MKPRTREGKGLHCPFCREELNRPTLLKLDTLENVLGGTCRTCGAFFIVDTTSKNVGEIMVQALGVVAQHVSKELSELIIGEDYEEAMLNYDWRTHRSMGGGHGFRKGCGRIYFVKWKR